MANAVSRTDSESAGYTESTPSGDVRSLWDSRAAARLDTFLFTAAATVLITRAYLAAAGYPQIGGSSQLHIAHVLWGGLLMGLAIAILVLSLGSAAKYWAAVIGGTGFGLFIDEVGKFLTKDVNYFFRPAVAVMYGILLVAYLAGREWSRRRTLDDSRVRAIAAAAIVDAELGQLSDSRRSDVQALLAAHGSGERSQVLAALLDGAVARSRRSAEEVMVSFGDRLHRGFLGAARRRWVRIAVFTLMAIQAGLSLLAIVLVAIVLPDIGPDVVADLTSADIISLAGIVVQTVLLTLGLILMAFHRWRRGLQLLRAGLFVALMFTTLLEFGQEQFGALASFAVVLVLFAIVGATAEAERRGEIGAKRKSHGAQRD